MPCTVSSSISASVPCPAVTPCLSATAGHRTRSPSTPSSGSSLTMPGRSSSIGKASTSVGPSFSIHCWLRVAMVSSSTALMHSSASGWTRMRSITNRLSVARPVTSTSRPDSLSTSMLIPGSTLVAGAAGADARLARVVLVVRRDDLADPLVPDDVVRGQALEGHVLDVLENALHDLQARPDPAGEVDLSAVTGDDDLGAA